MLLSRVVRRLSVTNWNLANTNPLSLDGGTGNTSSTVRTAVTKLVSQEILTKN